MWFSSEGEITRSALPKIALEVALLEIMHIKKALPIDDLISKIDKLQHQAGTSAKNVYTPGEPREHQPKASQESSDYKSNNKKEDPPESKNCTNKDAESFLNFVRQKHMQLVPLLQHGNLYLNNSEFIIELPTGSFQLDMLKDPEKENKVKELCDSFFNKDIKLTIRAIDLKKKTDPLKTSKDLKKKEEDDVLHNPVIQKVVETFSGSRILEIKTDL
jgi:DNA polymerase III gamma/tau subunit